MHGSIDAPRRDTGKSELTPILADSATTKDEFGSHSRVASAIVRLIERGSPGGRGIALFGPWGSGKSTVIAITRNKLEQIRLKSGLDARVFVLDAWAHQGDPIRRSFLEALIIFTNPNSAERKSWIEELDRITGRLEESKTTVTRTLSPWAAVIGGVLLFLVPLGGSFFAKYNPDKSFLWTDKFGLLGLACFAVPPLLLLIAKLSGQDVSKVLFRDAEQTTNSSVVKTREPSSSEFRALFAKIAQSLLSHPARRLVIVIDNLDRIESRDAVATWATMRTFFELEFEAKLGWTERLWLIVPIDRNALLTLWAASDQNPADADQRVESFLNKTFQVRFHISPPVLTSWKSYFDRNMRTVFPDAAMAEELQNVYRIYSLSLRDAPSPRDIKVFINQLSALYLQWSGGDDTLPLPLLAVYVIKSGLLRSNSLALLDESFLDSDVANLLSQYPQRHGWRERLAAVHFGVPIDEALQVLVAPAVIKAGQSGDFGDIEPLTKKPYFWTVLENIVAGRHNEWTSNPSALANILTLVASAPKSADSNVAIEEVWSSLIGATSRVQDWGTLDDAKGGALAALIARTRSWTGDLRRFVQLGIDAAARIPAGTFDSWAAGCNKLLNALHELDPTTQALFDMRIGMDASKYAGVKAALLDNASVEQLRNALTCSEPESLPLVLADNVLSLPEETFMGLLGDELGRFTSAQLGSFARALINFLPSQTDATNLTITRVLLSRNLYPGSDFVATSKEVVGKQPPGALQRYIEAGNWRAGAYCLLPQLVLQMSMPEQKYSSDLIAAIGQCLLEVDQADVLFESVTGAVASSLAGSAINWFVSTHHGAAFSPKALERAYSGGLIGVAQLLVDAGTSDAFIHDYIKQTAVSDLQDYRFITDLLKAATSENRALLVRFCASGLEAKKPPLPAIFERPAFTEFISFLVREAGVACIPAEMAEAGSGVR